MATLPTTVKEFSGSAGKFFMRIGDARHTQEQIQAAYRALTLQYLGIQTTSEAELESAAGMLQLMGEQARARGWEV